MLIVEKKEGSLIGLVKGYLDSKKFDHSLIKSIEPKRLVIGKDQKEINIKEDDCRMTLTYNDENDIDIGSSIRNIPGGLEESKRLRLITRKDSTNLDIAMGVEAFSGRPGVKTFVGDGNISITFRNYLEKPSEKTEIFNIDCLCQRKNLKCTDTREEF